MGVISSIELSISLNVRVRGTNDIEASALGFAPCAKGSPTASQNELLHWFLKQ